MVQQTDNVLDRTVFEALRHTASSINYFPLERGNDTSIFVAPASKLFVEPLKIAIEAQIGPFKMITHYLRLNGPETDTRLRIHSDVAILGEQPTHGIVLYIDAGEGGTRLFRHETLGDRLYPGDVLPDEDMSNEAVWSPRELLEAKPNRMSIYDASLFHQRWPTVPTQNRTIWCAFVQTIGIDNAAILGEN